MYVEPSAQQCVGDQTVRKYFVVISLMWVKISSAFHLNDEVVNETRE